MKKKNKFSFCISLAYSYLCRQNEKAFVMRKVFLFVCFVLLTSISSCVQQSSKLVVTNIDSTVVRLQGDSMVYGLACDGCTDTLLILLTDTRNDPDTFSVLDATVSHKVFGRPAVGDMMAVVLNGEERGKADLVIDMNRLKNTWCYEVTPVLKRRAGISEEQQDQFARNMPDSLRKKWMQPREFGYQLKSEHTVQVVGMSLLSDDERNSPVTYEKPRRYREWYLYNGKLLLKETLRDSSQQERVLTDTAEFVRLSRDTLVLQLNQQRRQFYRKL